MTTEKHKTVNKGKTTTERCWWLTAALTAAGHPPHLFSFWLSCQINGKKTATRIKSQQKIDKKYAKCNFCSTYLSIWSLAASNWSMITAVINTFLPSVWEKAINIAAVLIGWPENPHTSLNATYQTRVKSNFREKELIFQAVTEQEVFSLDRSLVEKLNEVSCQLH